MTIPFRRIPSAGGRIPELPRFATAGSAGADLCCNLDEPLTLEPMGRALVPTGLAMQLPDAQHGAFVFARSGLSIKHGLALSNGVGVIDSDYRGELHVGLVNLSQEAYTIQPGERIAQLVILPVVQFDAVEAEELEETRRGTGGFGSTGRV
ncbi:MAG: dUTP diphosphatase [Eubacteriales bacterium]|nr:dUTP diphosphatase [Eubacteriales bacterium]